MSEHLDGQVAASAASVYEEFFVDALFAQWPAQLLEIAGSRAGDRVLDVACGTGVLARAALNLVGGCGQVTGLDINEGMLEVAAGLSAELTWQIGSAQSLPFVDACFDRVLCQFGLMFFPDRVGALQEMARVLNPGGRACVAVWASLDATPGYRAVARMLNDLFGAQIASSIEAPYCLGEIAELRALAESANLNEVSIETRPGKARFNSLESWLYTDIRGWTLAEIIDDEAYARLQQSAPAYLGEYVGDDGRVTFDVPAHLMSFSA